MTTAVLPFRLKVRGSDEFRGLRARSISFRFRGSLRLEAHLLTIEWSGEALFQEVGPMTVHDDREALPDERIAVPVNHLYRPTLTGGWLRPRLTLQAKRLGALAGVPSEAHGVVQCWYARADRDAAVALVEALGQAMSAPQPQPETDSP